MYVLLIQVVVAVLTTVLTVIVLPEGTLRRRVTRGLCLTAATSAAATIAVEFARSEPDLYGGAHRPTSYVMWGLILLAAWLLPALVLRFAQPAFAFRTPDKPFRIRDGIAVLVCTLIGFIAGFLFFGAHWLYDFFGSMTADQLVFLVFQGSGSSTSENNLSLLNWMEVPIIASAVIGASIGFFRSDLTLGATRTVRQGRLRLVTVLALVVVLAGSTIYAFRVMPLGGVIREATAPPSGYIEANYVSPDQADLEFPDKPRNFVHIYLESIENSFYDKAHGGYDDRNIMPDLMALSDENTSFSHTDTHGGPHQTFGSGHSVASMMNMGAGVPMKSSPNGGTAEAMVYPDFPSMGDVLHDHGYQTSFMLGADSSWGGLGDYYRRHGQFDVFDHVEAINRGLLPPGYQEWWGFEDDKLYEYAKAELTRLAAEDKPFYFILENADTHFPGGYVSKNMKERPFEEQYANVIFYSQGEVVKFVNWMKTQPWWDNTTVYINGDHRSMDKDFFDGWDPDYERTVVNMIVNSALPDPGPEVTHNRDFAPFDMYPTTLAALGVKIKGNRLGLGTNLYSRQPTLIERDGVDRVNDELARTSAFYDNYRLDEKYLKTH